jgi:hypothetical protein
MASVFHALLKLRHPSRMSLKPRRFVWVLIGGFLLGGFLFALASPDTRLLGFIWLGTALALMALFGSFAYRDRRARLLRRDGIPGVGVIKSMAETGTEVNGRPVMDVELEVRPEGLSIYRARKRMIVMIDEVDVGDEVPIFVDRNDPQRLVVDWGSL